MNIVSDSSLVLYLPLYWPDGSSFMSRDACGHLCTVTGALWRPNGRYFDGTDDCINGGHPSAFNIEKELTLEAFIMAGGSGNYRGLIGKWTHLAGGCAYLLLITNSDYLSFRVSKDGGTINKTYLAGSKTAMSDGVAYHLAATYKYVTDGTSEMVIYVNGVEEASTSSAVGDIYSLPSQDLHMGQYGSGANFYRFTNIIGELRMHNRTLTPPEIMNNYLATKWRYQ